MSKQSNTLQVAAVIFGSLQNYDSIAWLRAMQVLSDKVYLPLVRKPNIAEVDSGNKESCHNTSQRQWK